MRPTLAFLLSFFLIAGPFTDYSRAHAAEPIQLPPLVVKDSEVPPIATPERQYSEAQAREAIDRTPGGVELVGAEEIKESLGTNLKEVLDFVPGVLIQGRQGSVSDESQFSIRGSGLRNNFHIRGINILVDGFTLNNADGFFRPEVLELFSSKRLEVYKGANALRFGGNSLGGAINLVGKTGADAGTDRDTGAFPRTFRIEHVFPLDAGDNRLTVAAVDTRGVETAESFAVRRRLRFYERTAFWPSMMAGSLGLVGLGFAAQRARRRRAVRNRFNPYIAGAPVLDVEMFFGREKLLARIMNVLHHNSLMITGERRIGKTTFLYHLKRALENDQATDYQFFPVFTDLQGVPEEGFFHTIMSDVVEGLRPAPETLAALRFKRDGGRLRRARLQPRRAARHRRAEDADAPAGEAHPADRRGGRPQRVLGPHQPAPAQHLHEDLLRAPGGGDERRRHQARVDERRQPLVQLLRRDRAQRASPARRPRT